MWGGVKHKSVYGPDTFAQCLFMPLTYVIAFNYMILIPSFSVLCCTGPRFDLDPDIVAAMDEDFDFDDPDNQLEDDFIVMAQGGSIPDEDR